MRLKKKNREGGQGRGERLGRRRHRRPFRAGGGRGRGGEGNMHSNYPGTCKTMGEKEEVNYGPHTRGCFIFAHDVAEILLAFP